MHHLKKNLLAWARDFTRPVRYFDWYFPFFYLREKFRREEEIEALVLVECFNRPGGHYMWWLIWFASEFSQRFRKVVILAHDYDGTLDFIRKESISLRRNIEIHEYSRKNNKRVCLTSIIGLAGLSHKRTAVFFMWGDDLIRFSSFRARLIPWGCLGSVSNLYRNFPDNSADEQKLVELTESSKQFRVFVQPDQYINAKISHAVWVPDVENIALPRSPSSKFEKILTHVAGSFSIGSFGRLWGGRCVNAMIEIAKQNPEIKVVLAGALIPETISSHNLGILKSGTLKNLLLINEFIQTEEELNLLITVVDAVFIDSSNYPLQSGIVIKGLHFGKFIATTKGNSWTCDIVSEFCAGCKVDTSFTNLKSEWEQWKQSSGPSKNEATAKLLTCSKSVRRQFDEVSKKLKMLQV